MISGSHTLQHPNKRQQHEMMAHAHIQQNMRAMGTHTLGRLPSHNHSPTHMTGKSNSTITITITTRIRTTNHQQHHLLHT